MSYLEPQSIAGQPLFLFLLVPIKSLPSLSSLSDTNQHCEEVQEDETYKENLYSCTTEESKIQICFFRKSYNYECISTHQQVLQ